MIFGSPGELSWFAAFSDPVLPPKTLVPFSRFWWRCSSCLVKAQGQCLLVWTNNEMCEKTGWEETMGTPSPLNVCERPLCLPLSALLFSELPGMLACTLPPACFRCLFGWVFCLQFHPCQSYLSLGERQTAFYFYENSLAFSNLCLHCILRWEIRLTNIWKL